MCFKKENNKNINISVFWKQTWVMQTYRNRTKLFIQSVFFSKYLVAISKSTQVHWAALASTGKMYPFFSRFRFFFSYHFFLYFSPFVNNGYASGCFICTFHGVWISPRTILARVKCSEKKYIAELLHVYRKYFRPIIGCLLVASPTIFLQLYSNDCLYCRHALVAFYFLFLWFLLEKNH